MHPRQIELLGAAQSLTEKTAAKKQTEEKKRSGPVLLWKYTDPDGNNFYLEAKKTTVKSPFSGKSFTARPERHTPAQVGKEMKDEQKTKTATEHDPWKA
jgi:hypothetical protein